MDHCGHCCPSDFFRPCRRRGKPTSSGENPLLRKTAHHQILAKQKKPHLWKSWKFLLRICFPPMKQTKSKGMPFMKEKPCGSAAPSVPSAKMLWKKFTSPLPGEEFAITSVQCYFSDEAQIEKVMELQEGDAITLVGVCDGKFGNVLIKDCVFE